MSDAGQGTVLAVLVKVLETQVRLRTASAPVLHACRGVCKAQRPGT